MKMVRELLREKGRHSSRRTFGAEVRRIFHKLCTALANENLNEHFKSIFEVHEQVPKKGRVNTTRFALVAMFVYQLALLHRYERKLEVNRRLKPFLRVA